MAKLIGELHHWWPRTVSKYWEDADGCTYRVTPKGGTPVKAPPKNYGAIRNDNHIKMGATPTVWDTSFESTFHEADSHFAGLVDWLLTFEPTMPTGAPLMMRLQPHTMPAGRHEMLAECLTSLIIRSPNFRNRVRGTVDHYRERLGIKGPANSSLIAMNVQHGQKMLSACFARRGKFVVMRASEGEFIFGDGFLHNISSVTGEPMAPRCLIPLTPTMAVFYTAPTTYSSYPKFFAMNLSSAEVAGVNLGVQVYSKYEVFYRSVAPDLHPEFTRGEFRQFQWDTPPGLREFETLIADGNWGPQQNYIPKKEA